MIYFVLGAALVLSANAFLQPRFARNVMSTGSIVRQELSLSAIKPDLFSGEQHRLIIKHSMKFHFHCQYQSIPWRKYQHEYVNLNIIDFHRRSF